MKRPGRTGGWTGLETALTTALSDLDPPIAPPVRDRLVKLFRLLDQWKGAGVVGFRTAEQVARFYFAEALQLRRFLGVDGPFLDVGSGGGTPALPLVLADERETRWTLLEPRRLSAQFLELAAAELGVAHRVRVVRARLREFLDQDAGKKDVSRMAAVTLRAVRLSPQEWRGLAASLSGRATVIWPTSASARAAARMPKRAFSEDVVPAQRGIVWLGRPRRRQERPS